MKEVLEVLPKTMKQLVESCKQYDALEEIRVRIGRPLECIAHGEVLIYTMEEELKRGYVTLRGGHRIGLAGKVITEKSAVKMIRDVSSFNIRIARQKIGIAEPLLPYLYESRWLNTMVIGPPQTGKTTLLRDVARCMSQGVSASKIPSCKVGIVDERSEIAGCVKGIPQYDFGTRVDVLDACPKAEGMMMMIRSMSPDILIVDEIGRKEDSEAIMEAVHAGVQLFISAHGFSYDDVVKRPSLKAVLELGIFDRFVELSKARGPGTVMQVKDKNGKSVLPHRKAEGVW